jgi:pilus assembly protein CpaF
MGRAPRAPGSVVLPTTADADGQTKGRLLSAWSSYSEVPPILPQPLQISGENISHAFVVPTVAAAIDLVVHTTTDAEGRRRVREIVAVPGRVEGDVVETADIFTWRHGQLVRADGFPPHADRFAQAGYDLAALLRRGESAAA